MTVQTGRRNRRSESGAGLKKASREAGRGHALLCSQPVSVRNQQAGPDPERPARVPEMESERIHPAVYLVSERAQKRLGPAHEPRTAPGEKRRLVTMSCAHVSD